ncbi:MAG: CHAD domain-containing protein, partial [Actinomycetota bacterium]|nr:CHAD domain-containing protein [Actinomycetota bacterium]
MRAVLRLVRGDLGKKPFRQENRRYRDAARLLSGYRDSDVLLETISALAADYPEDALPLDQLISDLEAEGQHGGEAATPGGIEVDMRRAADAIEAGDGLIGSWTLESSDWSLFERGLRRTYRDGRRALKHVESDPSPEALHEWRKRVKDLGYQLRLLKNAWKPALKAQARETGRLAEK